MAKLSMIVGRFLRAMRQRLCSHEFAIDSIRRVDPERVLCPCSHCDKVCSAPYGLALPGKVVW